ncbi:unnamed protein product [Urochloa humidicola]
MASILRFDSNGERKANNHINTGGRCRDGAGSDTRGTSSLRRAKLTRQRKLHHVDDMDVALGDLVVSEDDRASSSFTPPFQRGCSTPPRPSGSSSASTREVVARPPGPRPRPLHPPTPPSLRSVDLKAQEPTGVFLPALLRCSSTYACGCT